jgi:hypothetical protein
METPKNVSWASQTFVVWKMKENQTNISDDICSLFYYLFYAFNLWYLHVDGWIENFVFDSARMVNLQI